MASAPVTTTTVQVKSPFASKTNITAILLGLLGILQTFGLLTGVSPETIGVAVAAGAALVVFFRTTATSVLGKTF